MKSTVRVSFDVPIEEHIFLKTACVQAHISFRDLMKSVFHKTVEDFKKKKLHEKFKKRFESSYKKRGKEVTEDYLAQLEDEINNLDV